MENLSDRIRHTRVARGLTIEALALAAGVNARSIKQIEEGPTRGMNTSTFFAIVRALDMSTPRLFAWLGMGLGGLPRITQFRAEEDESADARAAAVAEVIS